MYMGLLPMAPGLEKSCNPPGLVADVPLQALPPNTPGNPARCCTPELEFELLSHRHKRSWQGEGAVRAPGNRPPDVRGQDVLMTSPPRRGPLGEGQAGERPAWGQPVACEPCR